MTSVQWLDEKLQDIMYIQYGYVNGVRKVVMPIEDYMKFKQEAKEMEKQQIIDAYGVGHNDGCSYMTDGKTEFKDAKIYYNKTFKK